MVNIRILSSFTFFYNRVRGGSEGEESKNYEI
jgi:hypothetical protein